MLTTPRRLVPVALLCAAPWVTPGGLSAQARLCASPEYRQFDFWIGQWRVESPLGTLAGHNSIERTGDCYLHESYSTAGAYFGESFNIYDAARGVWHQTWVDSGGQLLQVEGGFENGKMVLEGPGLDRSGAALIHRITWTVVDGDPDHVHQLWETSTDGGQTWSVAFDGHYLREPEK